MTSTLCHHAKSSVEDSFAWSSNDVASEALGEAADDEAGTSACIDTSLGAIGASSVAAGGGAGANIGTSSVVNDGRIGARPCIDTLGAIRAVVTGGAGAFFMASLKKGFRRRWVVK